ncbi:hypothetical protein [Arenibaculum sp.]|jgi:hypothetical protein|uniref:hypothetical protein n=1 Tax=Arenibaculum sp. TaxID=2865862 RepID=UPI002E0FEF1B|nr:hypothetical protein [Arenibaculum sp.]
MRYRSVAAVLAMLAASCGTAPPAGTDWEAATSTSARDAALSECDEQVDMRMQLRGYPRQPSPETPQYRYREAFFDKCMRDKGYEPG